MGCLAAVDCTAPTRLAAETALSAAFNALVKVDRLLHPTRAGSELATLNQAGAGERINVHPWTVATLRLSQRLWRLSSGMFDPALPGTGSIIDFQILFPATVLIIRPAQLDLGGIAKGFAIDRAIQALKAHGACCGQVNAGGDLRVFGTRGWPIRLRFAREWRREITLRNIALAVSDPDALATPSEHRGYYTPSMARHLPEPRALAVLAGNAALADGMTKVTMLAPPHRRAALLRQARARLADENMSGGY
jgi:thiamine biosynthesis lipoprotein